MLLALDVGNTNTVLGLYRLDPMPGETPQGHSPNPSPPAGSSPHQDSPEPGSRPAGSHSLAADWRVTTGRTHTADEFGVLLLQLFAMRGFQASDVTAIIIASVVPPVDTTLRQVCERYFGLKPIFVEPGIKTGMPILVDNPAELGADRIVNGVAVYARFGGAAIVVDLGTATTFDVINARGEYIGGVIAPGLGISADALFARAAKLARVDIRRPPRVIGTNTASHIQSGLFYGYIGLVDGILDRIIAELPPNTRPRILATGGLARLLLGESRYITEVDEMLTLEGLRILYDRNRKPAPARAG